LSKALTLFLSYGRLNKEGILESISGVSADGSTSKKQEAFKPTINMQLHHFERNKKWRVPDKSRTGCPGR
jgi:hypothetical protein